MLAGFAEGNAVAVVEFSSMLGHFSLGRYGAGLENAINMFAALDANIQDGFLTALRDFGSASGNGVIEALLHHFADYLEERGNGNQTTLRWA